jgi:hypothetical protein
MTWGIYLYALQAMAIAVAIAIDVAIDAVCAITGQDRCSCSIGSSRVGIMCRIITFR